MSLADGVARRASRLTDVLRIGAFAWYTGGNAVSLIGYWMSRIAIAWLAWELTRSPIWLGVVAFAEFAPSVVFSLVGGVLSDRGDRIRLLRFGQIGSMVLASSLAGVYFSGLLNIWILTAFTAGLGLIAGFNLPSRLAVAPSLVDKPHLPAAVAINSIGFNTARFVGPALAAPVLVFGGPGIIFLINAATFAFFVFCLSRIGRVAAAGEGDAGEGSGIWPAVRALLSDPVLAVVIGLQTFTGLALRPTAELFPAFADGVFGRGAEGLAALNAALGIGAICGALWASGYQEVGPLTRAIGRGALLLALTLCAFAMAGDFSLALAILVVHGAAMTTTGIASMSYVQTRAPADKLGRILSIYGIIFRAAPAIGALGLGAAAETFGLQRASLAVGVVGIAASLLAATLLARARRRA